MPNHFCSLKETHLRVFPHNVNLKRAELIRSISRKWVTGTVLTFYFYEDQSVLERTNEVRSWVGTEGQKNKVREAISIWRNLGIGVDFAEVSKREDARIRIGFMNGDGSWSYVGRDADSYASNERTMNFGWNIDVADKYEGVGTALHEIGHALGFEHEHQNGMSGIVWDEAAVYNAFAREPNEWDKDKTYHNILRKIPANEVDGTSWDPDSIMHYSFPPSLIKKPPQYYTNGLYPAGGLSVKDIAQVRKFYPPQGAHLVQLIEQKTEELAIESGEQIDFSFEPDQDKQYNIHLLGKVDAVLVLFEKQSDSSLKYLSADDNSATEKDALLKLKLFKDKTYQLKLRVMYRNPTEKTSIIIY